AGWTIDTNEIDKFVSSRGIRLDSANRKIIVGNLTGQRIEIDGTDGILKFYDPSSNLSLTIDNDSPSGWPVITLNAAGLVIGNSVMFTSQGINPKTLLTTASASNLFCSGPNLAIKRSTAGRRKDKENIRSIDIDTSRIYDLNPISFASKLDLDKKDKPIDGFFGLIAEEVHETLPNLCGYNEKGEPDWVQYQMLPILMLPEMQKLRDRIFDLETEVSTLKQIAIA
ncbi:MAG: tail fiber domain-containing protein, partial [Candidatus Brocadiales bacterium]|nr:tail fiber domain-containing protein [Candidatus Bathyanammoxibius sp.]